MTAPAMTARTVMLQGTCSSAGKSLLTAAVCRMFARRGLRVAPFKAQNMSNNAAVCADGVEIGRSQALQAIAAGVAPTADMNPILLKPEADSRSQVILNGRPWKTLPARTYYQYRDELWLHVTAALDRLRSSYDLVVIEGAGSPAELNLREREIVNMAVARYAQSPVLLIGDIERGGVFAQLLGTLWLLTPEERALVQGLIVNKFRGDRSLFDDGVTILEERGNVPVLGVLPYLPGLFIPEEDAATLGGSPAGADGEPLDIAVIRLPRISNFDDFDPLRLDGDVRVRFVDTVADLGQPAAIILPGTKSTISDLEWLRRASLATRIVEFAKHGTAVVGICGGFQMLGEVIQDPQHVESDVDQVPGLGLLPTRTVFERVKATYQVRAAVRSPLFSSYGNELLEGYEIHMGQTTGGHSWLEIVERNGAAVSIADGACSENGLVWGCYLHGLFGNDAFRRAWLRSLRESKQAPAESMAGESQSYSQRLEESLERLADGVEAALDMQRLERIIWGD